MSHQQHQSDPAQRARLRWRARRGLLENDLIIQRFFDKYEMELTDDDVAALTLLFEEIDNKLLDLLLGRAAPEGDLDTPAVRRVIQLMKDV
ncbi:succinate dehydrogenase assembly factor 2 [Limnobacter humi]|uniref:FAD assembly factor SdhE n=1 Tax=Limnobacter humi TaxID=1778671 RepID=A0ABT1WI91_9BURK|nr:succinate dehydrogenase assembly factor 2 [Limnobacter humi]MCQ8897240.1 succinate dehydrogenase assembly factor 2 [Limnobacter humi]